MITPKKAESIIEYAIDYAQGKAQGIEVTISSSDISTSRFANNCMTQNQSPDRSEVSIRLLKNGRQVRMTSDDLSASAMDKLIDDALLAAKHLEKDPNLLPLPAPPKHGYVHLKRFDKDTAELDAAARAKAVSKIIKLASVSNLSSAGIISSGAHLHAIGNSKGLLAVHKQTYAGCSVTMDRGGSTGWAKAEELSFSDLDYHELAARAAKTALANRDPVEIPPGKYNVILEPAAFLDLIGYLSFDFSATSHLDKLSCFVGKLGKKVFGENISISDDFSHPGQSGASFDGEGLPRHSLTLVENGILKNIVAGRRSAAKMGIKATGHGLPEPNAEGEVPVNLVFSGGNKSVEEMIAGQERAVLLTRVWYIREVDPALKIVTGMTRDGCFLIEDGKIVSALKNLRFNQSLIELLNNVIDMGPASRCSGGEEGGGAAVVPAVLVKDFNFSSITTF